ncbi:hypothetical protein [Nitrospira sp. Kam-Ns4a]
MDAHEQYQAWLDEKERELRWLIERRTASLEIRYYLLFLLIANHRYAKALRMCREILALRPDDHMALTWSCRLVQRVAGARRRKRRRPNPIRRWRGSCREPW